MKSNYERVKKACSKMNLHISPVLFARPTSPVMFDLLTNSKGEVVGKVRVWDKDGKLKGFVHINYRNT